MSKPRFIVVDVEADGPCPGLYSMICFGAVDVDSGAHFYGTTRPITDQWLPDALAVSGLDRTQHEALDEPAPVMNAFRLWLSKWDRPVFVSDNPAFDWQWINYYFHCYTGGNPFGYSARRIGDLYAGLVRDLRASNNWKNLRKTKHTHNPVDDARGNAEAFQAIVAQMGAKS